MEKINIAELLKDCPTGMELDCSMFDKVTLLSVDNEKDTVFPIETIREDGISLKLTKYGQYVDVDFAKCIIFPKGKTTWEGFVPPCKFKDGDVLFVDCSDGEDMEYRYIFILNNPEIYGKWHSYCHLDGVGYFHSKETYLTDEEYHPRLATEEEKQKLFDAIKEHGYKWNEETKTLEKLIKPKFKVGDNIRIKGQHAMYVVTELREDRYMLDDKDLPLLLKNQDQWELVPDKFDINTLVPFKSEVLVRDGDGELWYPSFWGTCGGGNLLSYNTVRGFYNQCVPYEGNEHLLGTNNDCDEYYKTWEEKA